MINKPSIPENYKARVEWLYKAYGKKLCGYAIKIYHLNEDAAWDLLYKSIYKVAETYDNYEFVSSQKLDAFVFKIYVNYLKNYFRDNKSNPGMVYLEDSKNELKNPVAPNPSNKNLDQLQLELQKLEDWERVLLLMRSQETPYSEISKFINKPEKQLKVYYQRLKMKLFEKLNSNIHFNEKVK